MKGNVFHKTEVQDFLFHFWFSHPSEWSWFIHQSSRKISALVCFKCLHILTIICCSKMGTLMKGWHFCMRSCAVSSEEPHNLRWTEVLQKPHSKSAHDIEVFKTGLNLCSYMDSSAQGIGYVMHWSKDLEKSRQNINYPVVWHIFMGTHSMYTVKSDKSIDTLSRDLLSLWNLSKHLMCEIWRTAEESKFNSIQVLYYKLY